VSAVSEPTRPRLRSVDLGNPFPPSLEGMCEILLVRHGEQAYVENMPLGEGIDAPLSELGRRQAAAVGERLASVELAAVYASPFRRAHDTGKAIAEAQGLEEIVREELAEVELWLGLPRDKSLVEAIGPDRLREIYREVNRTRRWDAYPHAEDRDGFRRRVKDGIDRIAADHVGERVAVAVHGGVINCYLSQVVESPYDQLFSIHHTAITTVRASGERRAIIAVNDYGHVLPFQSELNPLNVV
jgi:2,3-bisphosphoglycerate-dependent phosphoglycerate mutase